ncbi:MAG: plasmid stabilization protein [Sphingomicrobium sp.]|nr:plasmid stabilization protein [Sphingomonadales bacterium]
MPRGDKDAYTDKQERKRGTSSRAMRSAAVGKKEAEERAWRTVNARGGGGKESGSGRKTDRSAAAKKGWETRRKNAGKNK